MFVRAHTVAAVLLSVCAAFAGCDLFSPSTPVSPPPAPPTPAPVPTSAPAPAEPATSAPAAGACSLQGQWAGRINNNPTLTPFANSPVTADYRADHTIDWGTNMARFRGTWQVESDALHVTDTSSSIPTAACPDDVIGNYRLDWAPDCNVVTFRLTGDDCDGRRPALSDLRLTRAQP